MPLSFAHTRVTVPDRVISRAVDGMTVLLDAETGRTFTLDEIGTRAWTLLTRSGSLEQAFNALLGEFAVEPDQLQRDLETLVENLGHAKLLEISSVW